MRALIRPTADAGKRAALVGLGVELVEGDLKDAASLAHACAGVPAVIFSRIIDALASGG